MGYVAMPHLSEEQREWVKREEETRKAEKRERATDDQWWREVSQPRRR